MLFYLLNNLYSGDVMVLLSDLIAIREKFGKLIAEIIDGEELTLKDIANSVVASLPNYVFYNVDSVEITDKGIFVRPEKGRVITPNYLVYLLKLPDGSYTYTDLATSIMLGRSVIVPDDIVECKVRMGKNNWYAYVSREFYVNVNQKLNPKVVKLLAERLPRPVYMRVMLGDTGFVVADVGGDHFEFVRYKKAKLKVTNDSVALSVLTLLGIPVKDVIDVEEVNV